MLKVWSKKILYCQFNLICLEWILNIHLHLILLLQSVDHEAVRYFLEHERPFILIKSVLKCRIPPFTTFPPFLLLSSLFGCLSDYFLSFFSHKDCIYLHLLQFFWTEIEWLISYGLKSVLLLTRLAFDHINAKTEHLNHCHSCDKSHATMPYI